MSRPALASSLLVAAYLVSASFAVGQEGSYSEKRCQENQDCGRLENQRPDFSTEGEVIKVIDADTLRLRLYVLPGLQYEISVRARGVDAPEIFRPKCENEKLLGEAAKASIERKFPSGAWVRVSDLGFDKYGGRLVGQIDRWANDRFKSVAEELLEKNGVWGVPYSDGSKDYDWCEGTSE